MSELPGGGCGYLAEGTELRLPLLILPGGGRQAVDRNGLGRDGRGGAACCAHMACGEG
jgi:hypothetical protein